MSRITLKFDSLKKRGKCALIPYFMAHYPRKNSLPELLKASRDAGADLIEIGIPFSDPIADGPVIQKAGQAALDNGADLHKILESLRLKSDGTVPLLAMTYLNVFLQYGFDRLLKNARKSGIDGLVIPDLIVEESGTYIEKASQFNLDIISFVSPTTPSERLVKIVPASRGFVYLVSITGVTGARPDKHFNLKKRIREIRKLSDIPVCIGFGIATPAQAAEVANIADGIIMGSALIQIMASCKGNPASAVGRFLGKVRKAIDRNGV